MKSQTSLPRFAVALAASSAPARPVGKAERSRALPPKATPGGAAANLEYCDEPMGTIAVVEQEGDCTATCGPFNPPLHHPGCPRSSSSRNCFVVVERARDAEHDGERADGQRRTARGQQRGQAAMMVAADHQASINPSSAGSVGDVPVRSAARPRAVGVVVGGPSSRRRDHADRDRQPFRACRSSPRATPPRPTSARHRWAAAAAASVHWAVYSPEGKALAAAFANAYNNLGAGDARLQTQQQVEAGWARRKSLVGDWNPATMNRRRCRRRFRRWQTQRMPILQIEGKVEYACPR